MTEKRFKLHIIWYNKEKTEGEAQLTDNGQPLLITDDIVGARLIKDCLNKFYEENEQLKQQVTHLTVYKNLFREFQKQLDGVKKKSDLDHKDFEDLIELTKGHVFDDEHGWIWLPVNDR